MTRCFLLTSSGHDRSGHYEITLWAASEAGDPVKIVVTDFRPLFFVLRETPANLTASACERKALPMQTLDSRLIDCLYFDTYAALDNCRTRLRQAGLRPCESDVHPIERFLMERGVKGGFSVADAEPRPGAPGVVFVNPRIRGDQADIPLRVLSLDIETRAETGELYCIACSGRQETVFMIGDDRSAGNLVFCPDEHQLLVRFMAHLATADPDVIIGWNIINFDLMMLQTRCAAHHLEFDIGRQKPTRILPPARHGQSAIARVPGRVVLDVLTMVRGQARGFEHYSLDAVASELLGEHKQITVAGDEKIREINRLFVDDKPALAAYCLQDTILTKRIFDTTNILANAIERSRLSGHTLDRAGGSIAAFDYLYLPRLHRCGRVAPDIVDAPVPTAPLKGGYVMEPRAGIYENVLVLDFKSLYPTIILTFGIDPLGWAVPTPPLITGPAGISFSKTETILPAIINDLLDARSRARATRNEALSQAIKILMNSFYGVLGAQSCRFFSPALAEAVTATGRFILTRTIAHIEETTPHKVIYGDTDSLFVRLGPGWESRGTMVGSDLAAQVTTWLTGYLKTEFSAHSALELKFETHFRYFFMPALRGSTQGSKKRYCGAVEHAGALTLHFKGLEFARTDWTALAREFQHELYMRVFTKQPVETYIVETVERVRSGLCDDALVYRKGVRKELEEYTNHVPPHIQAARLLGGTTNRIAYVMTRQGPQPLEKITAALDYEHYITTQLQPIADAILESIGLSFDGIVSGQTDLFGTGR
jgi:DNA polymerase-2